LRMDRIGLQIAAPDADALRPEKAAIRIQQVRDVLTRRRSAHRPCKASFREVGSGARHAIAPSQVATIVADENPRLKRKESLRAGSYQADTSVVRRWRTSPPVTRDLKAGS
jgi:hypothetical protein